MMGNDWEWIEGSGIFRSNVWDSVKIRTESAAQETPLINRARYFFFFFYFALVRLAPPLPHRSPRHSLLHEFHDFFLVHASARPSHALHSRSPYPFLWKFPAENILPPSPQRWNSRYFKIPLFSFHFWKIRSLSEKYLFLPRSFRRDKETKDVYFNEYRDIDFLTFFFKTLFLLLLTSLESSW